MAMVKAGNDPRRRRVRQQKFFKGYPAVMVIGHMTHKCQRHLRKDFLTPFPTLYYGFYRLGLTFATMSDCYAFMDGDVIA